MVVAIIATIGVTLWRVYPEWQAYRAEQMLREAASEANHAKFDQAAATLRTVSGGSHAIDALSDVMRMPDDEVRLWAIREIGDLCIIRDIVVPALIEATWDRYRLVCHEATGAIRRLGTRAVPQLVAELSSTDPLHRAGAVDALGTIGPDAAAALPKLLKLAADDDANVREWTVWALAKIAPDSPQVYQVLIESLTDGNERVEWAAMKAIALPDALEIQYLVDSLSDGRPRVRAGAATALRRATGSAGLVVPALVRKLKDRDDKVRERAAASIEFFHESPQAVQAIPALEDATRDPVPRVQMAATGSLFKIDPQNALIKPKLVELADSDDANCRYFVAFTLSELQDPDTVPLLLKLLKDEDDDVRRVSADSLGQIAIEPRTAVPALAAALKDPSPVVVLFVAEALQEFGADAKVALPQLRQALADLAYSSDEYADYARSMIRQAIEQITMELPPARAVP